MDVLSGGRAYLGIGAAWIEREAKGLGVPFPPLAERFEHLEETLVAVDFLDREQPRRLMRRLRRLFNRTGLDRNEYNIVRGILAAIQEKIGQANSNN